MLTANENNQNDRNNNFYKLYGKKILKISMIRN